MASFLSKFTRGAAAAGGALYADVAREQLRADIMSQRDSVLNDNRTTLEKSRQEFETGQHKERMAQKESEFQRGLETPRAKAEAISLGSTERLEALKVDYSAATTDEERSSIAKLMAAEQGKPVEISGVKGTGPTAATKEARILATLDEFENEAAALKFLKGKEGNMTLELFKALGAKQEGAFIRSGDEGYMSTEELLKEARRLSKPAKPATGGDDTGIEQFNTTKYPSIKSQDDFDKLKSGDLYFDVFDGKSYRKP